MKKPNGYDEAEAVFGGMVYQLPTGNYIFKIVDAQGCVSKTGKQMLKIAFDVAEGEYKDFYKKKFENDLKSNPNAKYSNDAVYYQLTEGDSLGRFKGLIQTLEESNPQLNWNWDEKMLIACKFAGQCRNEPNEYNGKIYNHTKLVNIYPVSKLDELSILEDKVMKPTADSFGGTQTTEDIPF